MPRYYGIKKNIHEVLKRGVCTGQHKELLEKVYVPLM